MLDEDGLFRSSWSRRGAGDADSAGTGTAAEEKGWVYELHRCAGSGDDGGKNEGGKTADRVVGDVEVLDFLQSKSIVGIQDNYPFWRDHNHEPWSGKPVWVTSRGGRYDHHHVLLDDNIHNDPADGAGGIRVEGNDGSFRSLPGEEALGLHGRHLVRVPTVRAVMEDDWFIRQIEDARRRLLNDSLH
ncbi:hypothetical protein THAOC_14856 [Thalassiosira oceanica]|uniref:Uncharacterized protein n=1 Tax=Thalassiosira oceanica TaxID=159749 RepID=K0SHE2_THAOC|nr:hypothetical protein THAOC_14856 [Thalassiosira oceanica]|eukprot:EJK64409.1 hypothetical protein THAOC_14856 [Thalassiosira oceanica]